MRGGPFRFVRHPNYWVVTGEIAVLPLAFGDWPVAAIWSAANAAMLWLRIRVEMGALAPREAAGAVRAMTAAQPHRSSGLRLIDGTLVTPDKQITPSEALTAAADLKAAGVHFHRGLQPPAARREPLVAQLGSHAGLRRLQWRERLVRAWRPPGQPPCASRRRRAWGGARSVGRERDRGRGSSPTTCGSRGIAAGLYTDRERRALGFAPTVVTDFEPFIDRIDKIVGVSDQPEHLARVEGLARERLGSTASAIRSQTYYLDITHPAAGKGRAVRALAAEIGVDLATTAVIGDQGNDVAMFKVAAFSVAMGQSPADVQAAASAVTTANTDNGFAKAVKTQILPRAAQ